jgi:hypothetical protein
MFGLAKSAFAAEGTSNKMVMAFYYTWYGTPEVCGHWHHWPEGGHNPEKIDQNGYRDIGATNHPAPDVYDSNDPSVIRRHLALCEEMGIDALIATWWGVGDYHNKALKVVLQEAKNSATKVTIYYETIRSPHSVESAAKDFLYILDSYGNGPAWLKVNGKPVIFVYGRAMGQLGADDWEKVLKQVKAKHDALFIADTGKKELIEIFDGGHSYNPVGAIVRGVNMGESYAQLVKTCREAGKIACATVIPGYDDSNIGRARAIVAERKKGQLYRELWNLAMQARPDWILITSFNEWHEGSEIEPSKEHGRFYVELTREYSGKFK